MSSIVTFKYKKENFDEIKNFNFGRNWPVVYVMEDKKEIYIGQTVNAYYRSKQHYENPERRKLNEIHIITDEEFNISATLDIESWLIQYISADGKYILQNGNGGLKNHNYYDRVKYRTKFEITWEKLRESGITHNTLLDLENSDLFKYSPYKSLTSDQINIVRKIYQQLSKNERNIFIINGSAGTGKTILATFLLKYLKEQDKTKNFKIGLVLPMGAIRGTVKKVIKKIKGLNANMVIGPSESLRDSYDLLIVDESHRLHRSKNITNIGAHYKNNEKLGLGQKEGTELDWIIKQSKNQILFYDVDQLVHPSCIRPEDINKLKGQSFLLEEQMRIEAGEAYVNFIKSIFDLKIPKINNFKDYDLKIFDSIREMIDQIKEKDKKYKLSRVVAGYAWPWHTKTGKKDYDIEIDGVKLIWNSVLKDWINSKDSINEVGCIHTVQGYGLNYVGVIVGPEMSYDPVSKKLIIDKEKYFDINGKKGITDQGELELYIINIYKTLLTRGIKGTYIYIVDENLRSYFKKFINSKNGVVNLKEIFKEDQILSPYMGEMISLPMFESVGCGELMYADPNVQEMISVRKDYISLGSKYFVLRVSGDSMDKVGISDGDLVLCVKNYRPEEGKKVVALIGDDATIKEYRRENGYIILKPCSNNPKHKPLKFKTNEEIQMQGIVIRVLKETDVK